MKLMKTLGALGAAVGLVVASATHASAQLPPTVTATANGPVVTIQWTPVVGATAYNLVVTGSASLDVNVPASQTTVVAPGVPVGTYNIRVRGTAGAVATPFSNTATVTVGSAPPAPPCAAPPAAPAITAAVNAGTVVVTWAAVANAAGYQIQFSRFAGTTELSQNTAATSFTQFVGFAGTFFARVVALSACGNATSNEASFTIVITAPPGPRAPNPAPGQLISRDTLGYANGIVRQAAASFPGDLFNSCREFGGNNLFMFRLVQLLRARDNRWGMNDKRGQAGDMSQDIVAYNPTDRPDNGESQVYLFDVIGSHCGSNPVADGLNDVTQVTWEQRGNPACGTTWCARWTIDNYLRAGFPADQREQ